MVKPTSCSRKITTLKTRTRKILSKNEKTAVATGNCVVRIAWKFVEFEHRSSNAGVRTVFVSPLVNGICFVSFKAVFEKFTSYQKAKRRSKGVVNGKFGSCMRRQLWPYHIPHASWSSSLYPRWKRLPLTCYLAIFCTRKGTEPHFGYKKSSYDSQ